MAIYTWKCKNCGHEKDIENPISKSDIPPDTKCEECGVHDNNKQLWQKIIKSTTFILSGGGWYKDGYQKKGGN